MYLLKNAHLKYRCVFNIRLTVKTFSSKAYAEQNENLFLMSGFTKEMLNHKIQKKILTKKPADLKLTLQILLDAGFKPDEIASNAEVLHFTVWSIDHRLKLAEEGGFFPKKVDLSLIRRFPHVIQRSVAKLKKEGFIKEHVDVTRNILSYTDLPEELYPLPRETRDSKYSRSKFDKQQVLAMQVYLKWKLNLTETEIQYKFQTYAGMRMSSVRLVMRCYDVLINELKFPVKMVQSNPWLLVYYPKLFYEALENLPPIRYKSDMSDGSTWEMLKNDPELLIIPIDQMLKNLDICKEFGMDLERHFFNPWILSLSTATLRQRLKALKNDPILKPLIYMEGFPLLVVRFNVAMQRSEFLREAQQEFHNFNQLIVSENKFEGTLKNGKIRLVGNDLFNCLGQYFKMDPKVVREELKKNPFCQSVPLTTAWRTLEFLTTQDFTNEQLKTALTLLLYPQEAVEKELHSLESREEVAHCRDPTTGQISPELKLQLCLYFLEKPYHFTGQGIWAGNPPKDFFTLSDQYIEYIERKKNKVSNGYFVFLFFITKLFVRSV